MTGTLPLEIAPSLRLLLVGDSGVGKSQSRSLLLNSVPGQVISVPDSPDVTALAIADLTTEDNVENSTTNGGSNSANGKANGHGVDSNGGDQYSFKGTVSTLEIPNWLSVSTSIPFDGERAQDMVPAENVVLHDFVGYGQALDARQTIDRVDNFLKEQYIATRGLFGPAVTPVSSSFQESQPQLGPFLEQFLVDSTMAHSLPDACLYFVLYDLKPVDIIFMKRIMHRVNLIPILAKADTLTTNHLWKAKARILKQLEENQIEFFQFGFTIEDLKEMAMEKISGGPPFALSTSELETQQLGEPASSLTDLAVSINQGQFATSHSDLALLQTLLLGSKNRMLHQASVKKFMNRWRSDLGLPLDEPTVTVAVPRQSQQQQQEPVSVASPPVEQEVHHQEQQFEQPEQQQQQQQQQQHYEEPEQEESQHEQQQVEPQQQQYVPQQQPVPQHQNSLPPVLAPMPYHPSSSYQPSSTYVPYQAGGSSKGGVITASPQDEEVAQVVKLDRSRSVIRSASPAAKIYTQGGIVPAVPSAYNSTATSPSSTSPQA
ncbi:Neuronal-specific septin-3 [Gryganskiella cystojenkinii]|nr:Neuronal-specific septin-3 [Gryganskiella cystojenkinii]